jgi:hypothetical protein
LSDSPVGASWPTVGPAPSASSVTTTTLTRRDERNQRAREVPRVSRCARRNARNSPSLDWPKPSRLRRSRTSIPHSFASASNQPCHRDWLRVSGPSPTRRCCHGCPCWIAFPTSPSHGWRFADTTARRLAVKAFFARPRHRVPQLHREGPILSRRNQAANTIPNHQSLSDKWLGNLHWLSHK